MHMKTHRKSTQGGVTLIEVLISLIIIAIGVLGLSKIQALSISNAQQSGARGLIALQASSLAALMHANKAYWQVAAGSPVNCASFSCIFTKGSTTTMGTVPSACTFASPCVNPSDQAAYDVQQWMTNMYAQVPTYTATVGCNNSPVTCEIKISWIEKQMGGNNTTAASAATTPTVTQTYFLYVQP
jgi:type IV pilus assembly protein PilV